MEMERKLLLEGFNYTNDTFVENVNALELEEYWKGPGRNQETSFYKLIIKEGDITEEIEIKYWESESWKPLFNYCLNCEDLSYLKILKTYKAYGSSGLQSLCHMEDETYHIEQFDQELTNIEPEDALFEYYKEIGKFGSTPEHLLEYFDKEKLLRDWQFNNLPVIEINFNIFAILFR